MRQELISKLEKDLQAMNRLLIRTYRHDFLVEYLNIEKEIQIQKAYQQIEGE